MERVAEFIVKHRKTVLIVFLAMTLICAVLIPLVHINYKFSDYLPDDAPSTAGLRAMEKSFDEALPNVSLYAPDVSIVQALELKKKIAAAPGVTSVLWLDDVADVYKPLQMQDEETVKAWYRDGGALFSVTVEQGRLEEGVAALRTIAGDKGAIAGEAVNQAEAQGTVMGEIPKIMLFAVPLVFLILIFSTSSWFEPVLFLAVIGVAIAINEGTNIFQGEISFVTRATSAVLQLAVSMDYAVFLLHRYAQYRHEGHDVRTAMMKAMVKSFSAIAASAATTVLGFLVLALMRFKIGPDMGIVLAKGIVISFLSVVVLLPVLALAATKLMDRTHHRSFLPSFGKFGKFVLRVCVPLAIVALLLVVPGYLAQRQNDFVYGSSGMHDADSRVEHDENKITSLFGKSMQMVLLVPEGNVAAEKELGDALMRTQSVKSVVSYARTVGAQLPAGFVPPDQLSIFRANGYSRLILTVDTKEEGDKAFAVVDAVRATAQKFYADRYYLVGQTVVNYDLMKTITRDNIIVTIAAIAAIGLVLLLTFRSLSIPFVLLLTIETAVWINLGLPYFMGQHLNYIGYQIISSVQLGATVDYGILLTQNYMNLRQTSDRRMSAREAVAESAASILTPASILAVAGLMLGYISSNGIISQLGSILGRGAIVSALMVLLVLPALLMLLDPIIQKTTLKPKQKTPEASL